LRFFAETIDPPILMKKALHAATNATKTTVYLFTPKVNRSVFPTPGTVALHARIWSWLGLGSLEVKWVE
jgi:hypothetical protein